jgi:hypothetical protein
MSDLNKNQLINAQRIRQQRYRKLCENEPSVPIFSQAWWLDALAGKENWDVAMVENDGRIVAAMPYVVRRKLGRVFLGQPLLTQSLGPWIRATNSKQASRLGREKDLMQQLIVSLPTYDQFKQNWHHSQTNWLPFYWAGFSQTTRYTYRLPDLSDVGKLWEGFRENIRRDIRKAQKRFGLYVRRDFGIEDFMRLNLQTFKRQGLAPPYSKNLVYRLDSACQARQVRQVFVAEDVKGQHHAGVYIVWDQNSAYYLMGGGDPALRSSGATSLCMWEAIKYSATITKCFDFEGSMIEPIERFFRAFGAEQTPYSAISHTPSKLVRAAQCFRIIV